MSSQKELNDCHYLFIERVSEPHVNGLCVEVVEGKLASAPEKLEISGIDLGVATSIDIRSDSKRFRILFDSYISYAVLNESYSGADADDEISSGGLFREYTVSRFLDHIRTTTYASDDFPGKLRHFEIVCCDHIVDVISDQSPDVLISGADSPS